MYDILKTVSAAEGWTFIYARRDHSNLFNEVETGAVHLFLDPVEITENIGDYDELVSSTYAGTFMLLISSDIDDSDYEQRYIDKIKPILDGAVETLRSALICNSSVKIVSWRKVEVINMLDYNMDGIIVTYSLTENE